MDQIFQPINLDKLYNNVDSIVEKSFKITGDRLSFDTPAGLKKLFKQFDKILHATNGEGRNKLNLLFLNFDYFHIYENIYDYFITDVTENACYCQLTNAQYDSYNERFYFIIKDKTVADDLIDLQLNDVCKTAFIHLLDQIDSIFIGNSPIFIRQDIIQEGQMKIIVVKISLFNNRRHYSIQFNENKFPENNYNKSENCEFFEGNLRRTATFAEIVKTISYDGGYRASHAINFIQKEFSKMEVSEIVDDGAVFSFNKTKSNWGTLIFGNRKLNPTTFKEFYMKAKALGQQDFFVINCNVIEDQG